MSDNPDPFVEDALASFPRPVTPKPPAEAGKRESNSEVPVLDQERITELRRAKADYGNPLLIRQLVDIYRINAPKRLEQLRRAIANADARTLALVAHTLKTNCAMLGALEMSSACALLEEHGDQVNFVDAAAVLARAEAEFERVQFALTELLAGEPESV